jgi:hypothetical protein
MHEKNLANAVKLPPHTEREFLHPKITTPDSFKWQAMVETLVL